MSFPKELYIYINNFYLQLGTNYIADIINEENICECTQYECIKEWYNGRHKHDLEEYWEIVHCSIEGCHVIFLDGSDEGFLCEGCDKVCCSECRKDYDTELDESHDICIECKDLVLF